MEGNQFVEGRHLSPISDEGGFQPIVYSLSARYGARFFVAVCLSFVGGCVANLSLTVSSGVPTVIFGSDYLGCVIKQ